MGNNDLEKTPKDKEPKTPPSNSQEHPASTVNPDWSGFQAYSHMPPHGFLASNPQAHPYMWGVQHIMPPYGTPPHPYVAMYPPGGIYPHPSIPPGSYPFSPFAMPSANGIPDASGNTPGSIEADSKPQEVKEKLPIKRSKESLGSLNMITGKNIELGKTPGTSANGVLSKSGESGNEGSSEGSDSNSQNDSQHKSGGRQDSFEEMGQNGNFVHASQNGIQSTPHSMTDQSMNMMVMTASGAPGAVPGPTTNLNIGMDFWGTPATSAVPAIHGKVPSNPVTGAMVTAGSLDSSQPWIQDERELKRQKRKQSNRESARRSRLRKQAECDELSQRAEVLKAENASLRSEVNRIRSEYEQLLAENASLKERLGEVPSNEDLRHGGNEQHLHIAQETGQPQVVKDIA